MRPRDSGRNHHRPPKVDLEAVVTKAIREARALDELLSIELWGSFDVEARAPWPAWARELFMHAVWLFEERMGWTPQPDVRLPEDDDVAYLEWTWKTVLELVKERSRWWDLGQLSWERISRIMGTSQTQAQYRFNRTGWRFRGIPGRRWVVAAPCRTCGELRSPYQLGPTGLCHDCQLIDVIPPLD